MDIDPIHFGEEPMDGLGTIEPHWDRLELAGSQVGFLGFRFADLRYLPGSAGP